MAPASTQKRRRLTAEQRRERILRGATRVFAERGFQEASMTAIARAGGITPAVIYDHFPSKAALHITLLERENAEMLRWIGAALAEAPEGIEVRMRAGVDAFFRFVQEHRFSWRLIFRDPPTDPQVQKEYRRLGFGTKDAVEAFLRTLAPPHLLEGEEADDRAAMLAQMLTSSMSGLAFWWYEHREVPREVVVDRVMEFCWTGLERLAAGE